MLSDCSLVAWQNIDEIHRNKSYQRILATLTVCGPLTREQISQETGIRLQTVCGRVNELEHEYRVCQIVGKRTTTSGSQAGVVGVVGVVVE